MVARAATEVTGLPPNVERFSPLNWEAISRVVMVAYTDQTLINVRKRSPLDRGLLSRVLRNLDGMGAKAIGIDILFDLVDGEDDPAIVAEANATTVVEPGWELVVTVLAVMTMTAGNMRTSR